MSCRYLRTIEMNSAANPDPVSVPSMFVGQTSPWKLIGWTVLDVSVRSAVGTLSGVQVPTTVNSAVPREVFVMAPLPLTALLVSERSKVST